MSASLAQPGAEGSSAGERSPSLRAPSCGSPLDAQDRAARGEPGVRGTRRGRAQPARWVGYLEGGRWRGLDTILDTPGTPQVGQSRAVGFLGGSGPERLEPQALPAPKSSLPTPRGCCTRGWTLPHAARGTSNPALSGEACTTCFAANRRRRFIQSDPLLGAAPPPPLRSDKASIALSDWALSCLLSPGRVS